MGPNWSQVSQMACMAHFHWLDTLVPSATHMRAPCAHRHTIKVLMHVCVPLLATMPWSQAVQMRHMLQK